MKERLDDLRQIVRDEQRFLENAKAIFSGKKALPKKRRRKRSSETTSAARSRDEIRDAVAAFREQGFRAESNHIEGTWDAIPRPVYQNAEAELEATVHLIDYMGSLIEYGAEPVPAELEAQALRQAEFEGLGFSASSDESRKAGEGHSLNDLPEPPAELLMELTPRSRDLLHFLWGHRQTTVEMLDRHIYGNQAVTPDALRTAVRRFNEELNEHTRGRIQAVYSPPDVFLKFLD